MLTRLILGLTLYTMTISFAHAEIYDDLNKNNAQIIGLGAHWVGSEYTSGNWVDRTTQKVAIPTGTVSRDETTSSVSFDGGYFTVSADDNPLAGVQNYTILVNFTPLRAGVGTNWYSCTGLVDMEMARAQNDWGLEYNGSGQIVGGMGMQDRYSDYQSNSTSTITLNESCVVGTQLEGRDLSTVFEGGRESIVTLPSEPQPRASSAFRIGRCATNTNPFYGSIREIRMFNRALNTSELNYYSAEMSNDFQTVEYEYDQTVVNPAHTLITVTSGMATMEFTTETLPAGICVGGGLTNAVAAFAGTDLQSINMTYLLPKGSLVLASTQSSFSKTLNLWGGTLDTSSGTFSTATDARIVMTDGSWNGQTITLGGQTFFQMTGGAITLTHTSNWLKTLVVDTPNAEILGGTLTAGEVNIGNGSRGILNFQSGKIIISNTNIGRNNEGTFLQKGGELQISSYFSMGDQSAGEGTYELSDGILNARIAAIGNRGSGSYVQKGGTATFNTLNIGHDGGNTNSGGAGSVELQGGTLKVNTGTVVGQPLSNSSRADYTQGYFLQSGGTLETPTLVLGNQRLDGKETIFDLTGGILKAGSISGSTDLLNLTGGMLEVQNVSGSLINQGSTLHLLNNHPTAITGTFEQRDGRILIELNSDLSQNYSLIADSLEFATSDGIELVFNPEDLSPGMEIDITLATPNNNYDWLPQLTSEFDWGYYFLKDFNLDSGTLHLAVNSGAIPEPSTWLMLCLGMVGLVSWKKMKIRR